jgi:hypothetical protein
MDSGAKEDVYELVRQGMLVLAMTPSFSPATYLACLARPAFLSLSSASQVQQLLEVSEGAYY